MKVFDEVHEAVESFKEKNKHVIVIVKDEVFGVVICMDHKLAHTRTNVMFTKTELESFGGNLKQMIMDVCEEMVSILIRAQKTK